MAKDEKNLSTKVTEITTRVVSAACPTCRAYYITYNTVLEPPEWSYRVFSCCCCFKKRCGGDRRRRDNFPTLNSLAVITHGSLLVTFAYKSVCLYMLLLLYSVCVCVCYCTLSLLSGRRISLHNCCSWWSDSFSCLSTFPFDGSIPILNVFACVAQLLSPLY